MNAAISDASSQAYRRRTGIQQVLYLMRREWSAYLFLAPGLLLFAIFTLYAVGFSFYLSFHEWNILETAKPFIGLENYIKLFHDFRFTRSVVNTVYYTAVSVPLTMLSGLIIALLLNNIKFRGIYRTLYYIPTITPLVVAAIIWKWVYQGDYGLLNYFLTSLGLINKPVLWLSDPSLAMPSIIIMSVWGGAGYDMVIYLSGLQAIPEEYYDAAKVDGASGWQQFRYITVPLLNPTTFFLLITSIIGSFQIFTQIFVMTNGGPLNRTTTIGYYLYQKAFTQFQMGYASAIAYALFAMIFVFSVLQMHFMRQEIS